MITFENKIEKILVNSLFSHNIRHQKDETIGYLCNHSNHSQRLFRQDSDEVTSEG
jgi:hypothetical protein